MGSMCSKAPGKVVCNWLRCAHGNVCSPRDSALEPTIQASLRGSWEWLAQRLEAPTVSKISDPGWSAVAKKEPEEVHGVRGSASHENVDCRASEDSPEPNERRGKPAHDVAIRNEHLGEQGSGRNFTVCRSGARQVAAAQQAAQMTDRSEIADAYYPKLIVAAEAPERVRGEDRHAMTGTAQVASQGRPPVSGT